MMNREILSAALSAGMTDMLRMLLTAVGVAAAGCLIWFGVAWLRRKGKKQEHGTDKPAEDSSKDDAEPR